MKKITLCCFTFLMVSSVGFSQMKLQLFSEIANEKPVTFSSHILEPNLKLELQPEIILPTNENNLSEPPWLIGFLLDVSLPGGDLENKLETGYSGHFYAGYFVSTTFLLSLRIGYIKFGTGVIEDDYYKSKYEQSYVPLLLGFYYVFETGGAFRPYFGLALGPMIQSYSRIITLYRVNSISTHSDTELTFGLVPELGFYYFVASTTMIQFSVSYSIAGSGIVSGGGGGPKFGTYLSFLAGISFALGGD
jgi:hypothetical protein